MTLKEREISEDQAYLMRKLNLAAASPLKEEDLIQFNSRYGVLAVTGALRYMAYSPVKKPFSYLKVRLRG